MKAQLIKVAALVLCVASRAHSQRASTYLDFEDVRNDGNGIAALQKTVTIGFANRTAGEALSALALNAQISVTYEPTHQHFQTRITVPEHSRSVAAALLEIGQLCEARVLVSRRGQIVISPNERGRIPLEREQPAPLDTAPSGERVYTLPKLRVEATRTERLLFDNSAQVSALTLSAAALRATPSFVEPDILRSVQMLPGVEARSDWAAGFSVRGGEADQSAILLDGYPIYNPFHLGGVFSTFIDPAVGKVELHTGALPARIGGRLSGALDVSSAQPTTDGVHGQAELSLISSMATAGSTFDGGEGTWMIAGRRSYADMVVNLFKANAFPYHFEDLHSHVERNVGAHSRLALTGYVGRDVASGDATDSPYGGWGNGVVGATLTSRLGAGILGDSGSIANRVSWTRFWAVADFSGALSRADNDVSDFRASSTLSMHRGSATTTFGAELSTQALRYQSHSIFRDMGDIFPFDSVQGHVHTASLFADNVWRPAARLLLDVGLRADITDAANGAGISPRLSAKYFVNGNTALTASAARTSQWLQSLGRGEEPLQPFQFWVPVPRGTRASEMHEGTLGLERWVTSSQILHIGSYYKRYDQILVPNPVSDPLVPQDELLPVKGSSYGLDVLWRELEGGAFSGWMSYSYALSRRVDDAGTQYWPPQDRRHNLNLVGSWRASEYTFGLRANFASGYPTTPVLGEYARDRYDPLTHRWITDGSNQVIPGPYNSDRLPAYQRVDVSLSRAGHFRGVPMTPYVSVLNILNTSNPAAYIYSLDARPTRGSFPNLPIVPTFGVSFAY